MKKLISLFLVCITSITLFAGCGNKENVSDNIVNISILNSKTEIESELNELIEEFTKENKDINIKVIKIGQTGKYKDKLDSMYQLGNAPTMSIIDTSNIDLYKENCLDLSNEKWINDISGEVSDIVKTDDGKIIGFPLATEGIGFIYNKKVLNEAGVDVEKINTISALKDAFDKIEAIGKKGLIVTNEDWSLGDHFLATYYAVEKGQLGNKSSEYFDSLKSTDLKNNKVLNGLIDTFDLMKQYNIYSDNPLLPTYSKCSEIFSQGNVGFWYMGNWVSQEILNNSSGNNEFGFIPVPISNDSSDYGNNEIALGVTKYIIVDDKNSSEAQQEAAKKFLNYLVYSDTGKKFLVDKARLIPAFDNLDFNSEDPLTKDIIKYRNGNKTMELMNSYLPLDNSKVVGEGLRRYLNNEINREELINIIETFWAQY